MATAHKKLTATAPVATVFKGTEHEAKTLILQQSQQSKQQHLIHTTAPTDITPTATLSNCFFYNNRLFNERNE